MRKAVFRPSNHRIAKIFVAFMACSLTLLGYQARISRLLPLDTSNHSLVQSIRMTHERTTDCAQADDTENKQSEHALVTSIGSQVRSSILQPPGALTNLHLDLIAHPGYRRPPPSCQ